MKIYTALFTTMLVMLCITACTTAPPQEIATENGTENGNQLGAIQYTIKSGDNLVLIASEQTRASENWRRIADFNRIVNPATIKPGQVIWIPNDLIPLTQAKQQSREVAGHPDATVSAAKRAESIKPIGE